MWRELPHMHFCVWLENALALPLDHVAWADIAEEDPELREIVSSAPISRGSTPARAWRASSGAILSLPPSAGSASTCHLCSQTYDVKSSLMALAGHHCGTCTASA